MLNKNKNQKKILDDLRSFDPSVARIKFSSVTVYRQNNTIRFNLICDKAVPDEIKIKIEEYINELIPDNFAGFEVSIKKVIADEQLVCKTVFDYIKERHSSFSHLVNFNDVSAEKQEDVIVLKLKLEDDVIEYFNVNGTSEEITNYLGTMFCDTFKIVFESKGFTPVNKELLEFKLTDNDLKRLVYRTFKVSCVSELFDKTPDDIAMYIADVKKDCGAVCLAGTIVGIRELQTKKGKPYFIIDLNDKTGKITGKIFPNKDKVEKVKKLEVGFDIIVKGDVGSYNGYTDLMIKTINLCKLPENFVPMQKPSRLPPDEYKTIIPSKLENLTQHDFLTVEEELPQCLKENVFVVFDIETTGLEYAEGDKITEIGAVKIVDGIISEKFATLINPQREIPEQIVNITGITDEMVKDSPVFDDVVGDFFKFCDGAIIVAQNAQFDMGFVKYYSKPHEYFYNHRVLDTVTIAREMLPKLKNHKLNTLAEHFKIDLIHHRAWNDAYATAKIFIELIKMKKCLPNN